MSSTTNCATGKSKCKNVSPTTVRRRQSDAKWRASLQSCYETLKLILPESYSANRRKLSKAFILQETESHISYLEDVLTNLLEEKQKQVDHGLIVPSSTRTQTLQEIKHEFALKIEPPLQHIPVPKKLKNGKQNLCSSPPRSSVPPCSEPDSIMRMLLQGDQYYNLSSKTVCLRKVSPPRTNVHVHHLWGSTANFQLEPYAASSMHVASPRVTTLANTENSYTTSQSPCSSIHQPSSDPPKSDMVNFLTGLTPHPPDQKAEVFLPQMTPCKDDSESIAVHSPWRSAALSSLQYQAAFLTPSKVTRKLTFDVGNPSPVSMESSPRTRPEPNSPYFGSPVPSISDDPFFQFPQLGDSFMEVPSTPVLKSPSLPEETHDANSLLCTESMELGDEADWYAEKSVITKKLFEEDKDLQLTPCPDYKMGPSHRPSEKPKKAGVKRNDLMFSEASKSDVTPAKGSRLSDKPKCCKQLDILYDEDSDTVPQLPLNVISLPKETNQCSSFDGYFYFYRQMSGALEQHLHQEEIAEAISNIWKDMNEDQKETLATIAALENSNSALSSSNELSEDLSGISVTPICPTDLIQVVPVSSSQVVKKGM